MVENQCMQFSQPTGTMLVSHLSFADDIIIFSNGCKKSLQLLMGVLNDYQNASGQLLNIDKCTFMTAKNNQRSRNNIIHQQTGFSRQEMPIKYLGCPIFSGRAKVGYFSDLISNIRNKVEGWHTKLLSQAGKLILITHVLQSMPIHICSAINPPKSVLHEIDKVISNCFWNDKNVSKHHWIAWSKCCRLKEEGGIGLKKLEDIVHVQSLKLFWKLVTENSLWSAFMKTKYIKEFNNPSELYSNLSINWRRLRLVRDEAQQIMDHTDQGYRWSISPNGIFSSKHTWNHIREEGIRTYSFNFIWSSIIPRRVSIFMWKLLHNRLPLDIQIRNMGISLASKCRCCTYSKEENLHHLFLNGDIACKIWQHYINRVGISVIGNPFNCLLKSWWRRAKTKTEDASIFHLLPAEICWNIWKGRNRTVFDNVKMNVNEIVEKINRDMLDLYKSKALGTFSDEFDEFFRDIFCG